jgi:protein-S-isoprenylcysteine O-methyltransferase Ste14
VVEVGRVVGEDPTPGTIFKDVVDMRGGATRMGGVSSNPSQGGYDVARAWVQLLAAAMAATNAAAWVWSSRWERPGLGVELRARLQPLPLIGRGGDLVQVAPFVYPVLVVVAPGWAYEGWLNWSTEIDPVLQAVGLGLWALGIALGVWAGQAIGGYGAVSGVTVDHQLVSDGPYRYVRHPIYTAMIAVAVGTTLVFRSYLLLGVAALSILTHLWWAAAEERLLSSPEGLGDAYSSYASHTGRFLPRVRRARRPTGSS